MSPVQIFDDIKSSNINYEPGKEKPWSAVELIIQNQIIYTSCMGKEEIQQRWRTEGLCVDATWIVNSQLCFPKISLSLGCYVTLISTEADGDLYEF